MLRTISCSPVIRSVARCNVKINPSYRGIKKNVHSKFWDGPLPNPLFIDRFFGHFGLKRQHFERFIQESDKWFKEGTVPFSPMYHLLRRCMEENPMRREEVQLKYDQDVFEVKLDVQNYEPEDLSVKVQDEHLIVSGKHENKADELGCVARQFTRQFLMPEDIDHDTLSSSLSLEGILTVRALVKGASKERLINIDRENNIKKQTSTMADSNTANSNTCSDSASADTTTSTTTTSSSTTTDTSSTGNNNNNNNNNPTEKPS